MSVGEVYARPGSAERDDAPGPLENPLPAQRRDAASGPWWQNWVLINHVESCPGLVSKLTWKREYIFYLYLVYILFVPNTNTSLFFFFSLLSFFFISFFYSSLRNLTLKKTSFLVILKHSFFPSLLLQDLENL